MLSDTGLLHHLRYAAYGIENQEFDYSDVAWPGKSSLKFHGLMYKIRCVVKDGGTYPTDGWIAVREDGATYLLLGAVASHNNNISSYFVNIFWAFSNTMKLKK